MRTLGTPGAGITRALDISLASGNEGHVADVALPGQGHLRLRPYQEQCVAALRRSYAAGRRAPLLVLPTGGGKTVIFASVTAGARSKGRRVLILVHRRELIGQACSKLALAGVKHGVMAAGLDADHEELVIVGSVQSLARRLERLPSFDLVVIDEAHHGVAGSWRAVLKSQPDAKLLGVTATPMRFDGNGLGIEDDGIFDDLVTGPTISDLVGAGYLSPAKTFVPAERLDLAAVRVKAGDYVTTDLSLVVNRPEIIGDAVAQYNLRVAHKPAVAFCCTVAHADHVAEMFRAAGYRSRCVHGGMAAPERDSLISGLSDGRIEVLTTCDLISEGLDVPSVAAVLLLRPTKSLSLFLQQVGRGLRPAPGKIHLTILDHAANTLLHGLPTSARSSSLKGQEKPEPERPGAGEMPVWLCPSCNEANPAGARACDGCGALSTIVYEQPLPLTKAGGLVELTPDRLQAVRRLHYGEIMRGRFTETELREYARARGYNPFWVKHRLREQGAAA